MRRARSETVEAVGEPHPKMRPRKLSRAANLGAIVSDAPTRSALTLLRVMRISFYDAVARGRQLARAWFKSLVVLRQTLCT